MGEETKKTTAHGGQHNRDVGADNTKTTEERAVSNQRTLNTTGDEAKKERLIRSHRTLKYRDSSGFRDGEDAEEQTAQTDFDSLTGPDEEAEVKAFLIVLSGVTSEMVFRLGSKNIIGRGSKADLRFDDATMSRTHACLFEDQDGEWMISDLGSQNGTFLNGHQVKRHTLVDGDKIRIGKTSFKFAISYPLE